MEKYLLINKEKGWTSHDVVAFLKGRYIKANPDERNIKIGHAGTLDPFATGLLIVGIGKEATKKLDQFKNQPKKYLAKIRLGLVSDTLDSEGKISEIQISNIPKTEEVKKVLELLKGDQMQIPPMFSAKKINGKKLYELARAGKQIDREPVKIHIYDIKLVEYDFPDISIQIECSPGTYIRVLAEDIGKMLGTGAICQELERTAIGNFTLKEAKKVKEVQF